MTSIPIKTALLVPGDDVIEVARMALAAAGITPQPSDILVICETPLAITQGRIVHVDALVPCLTARVFCRLFSPKGSLGTAYGMQTAIDVAGRARIALALAAGLAGRLIGRRGDFYRVAGRQVAWIDDVTGTMPPYSQDIILGPDDPRGVAVRMAQAMGCGAAVVDANDLGRVEIMGASAFVDRELLIEAMRPNPQGNDDEQTPLVLVRA
ncbi:MAG: coenzyme F420-0:L-glutamate ligase [Actinomycetota bacterium]|nr:coenzyme F420-0:L-glutamate ligase [Actinomycetota bacterium]